MQPNKTKIAIVVGAMYLGVSGASMAASESFNITAATIADVVITENTALDFGANIFTTAGNCSMDAAAPLSDDIHVDDGTTVASGYGDLSGTSCIIGNAGTPGVYTVSGSSGSDISITLGGISTADFTFSPDSSAYGIYNGAADSGDSIGTDLSTSGATPLTLADGTDASGVPGAGVVDGELMFTLGGTLTILQPLTSETVYGAETFTVSVTY
jgi:hypothetical protein